MDSGFRGGADGVPAEDLAPRQPARGQYEGDRPSYDNLDSTTGPEPSLTRPPDITASGYRGGMYGASPRGDGGSAAADSRRDGGRSAGGRAGFADDGTMGGTVRRGVDGELDADQGATFRPTASRPYKLQFAPYSDKNPSSSSKEMSADMLLHVGFDPGNYGGASSDGSGAELDTNSWQRAIENEATLQNTHPIFFYTLASRTLPTTAFTSKQMVQRFSRRAALLRARGEAGEWSAAEFEKEALELWREFKTQLWGENMNAREVARKVRAVLTQPPRAEGISLLGYIDQHKQRLHDAAGADDADCESNVPVPSFNSAGDLANEPLLQFTDLKDAQERFIAGIAVVGHRDHARLASGIVRMRDMTNRARKRGDEQSQFPTGKLRAIWPLPWGQIYQIVERVAEDENFPVRRAAPAPSSRRRSPSAGASVSPPAGARRDQAPARPVDAARGRVGFGGGNYTRTAIDPRSPGAVRPPGPAAAPYAVHAPQESRRPGGSPARTGTASSPAGPPIPRGRDVAQRPRRPPPDMTTIRCYNCQEHGHFARDCKEPSTRRDLGGTDGHLRSEYEIAWSEEQHEYECQQSDEQQAHEAHLNGLRNEYYMASGTELEPGAMLAPLDEEQRYTAGTQMQFTSGWQAYAEDRSNADVPAGGGPPGPA
jgi:hypothetical protein